MDCSREAPTYTSVLGICSEAKRSGLGKYVLVPFGVAVGVREATVRFSPVVPGLY